MSAAHFLPPHQPLDVVMSVPGSKSIANRALICALLANGQSTLQGLPDGDDTSVIVEVLTQMSAITHTEDGVVVTGNSVPQLPGIIDAQLAGTSSRFLTAVAGLSNSVTLIDGGEPLRNRPMQDLHSALVQLGAIVEPLGQPGHLPVSVSGGHMLGGLLTMRSNVSSQFISSLMLIGPLLKGGLQIELVGEKVSQSYVAMTARVMAAFGVDVTMSPNTISIPEAAYQAVEYVIEPDFSSAAFPIVGLLIRGGRLKIKNLARAMQQGDSAILDIARQLGAMWQIDGEDIEFHKIVPDNHRPNDSVSLLMSDCSDLVPAVAVAASVCVGRATISGVGFIRQKESDRIVDLAAELSKVGIEIRDMNDGLEIHQCNQPQPGQLQTHHDHRLAMSFALLSLVQPGIVVTSPEVVSKSWPQYFVDMANILGDVVLEN